MTPPTPWSFGDLRAFFQSPSPPTEARFQHLWAQLELVHEVAPYSLDTWLPYALRHLEPWPDANRSWTIDTQEAFDDFPRKLHPLHTLARALDIEEIDPNAFQNMLNHPNASTIRVLCIQCDLMTPSQLRHILNHQDAPSLTSLTFFFSKLRTEHIHALAQCDRLSSLRDLGLYGNTLDDQAMRALAQSPHLHNLRTLHLQPEFGDPRPSFDALRPFCTSAPHLQTTYGEPYTIDQPHMPRALRTPTISTRANVEALLEWLDTSWDYCVCDPERRSSPDPNDPEDIMCTLTLEEHAIDEAFDAHGALVEPLSLHLHSPRRGAMWPTLGGEGYHGAHWVQTSFAMLGLHIEAHTPQTLVLHPETHQHATALVRTMNALWELQEQWGAITIACASTHHHDLWPELDIPEKTPHGGLFWNEYDHSFNARGELPEGSSQTLCISRDIVLFSRTFARHGLALSWPPSDTDDGIAQLSDAHVNCIP